MRRRRQPRAYAEVSRAGAFCYAIAAGNLREHPMQIINSRPSGCGLLTAVAFAAVLAFAATNAALAGCGGGGISGAHPASSGSAGIHSGASASAGSGSSSGVSSCGVNATGGSKAGSGVTGSLAGIHTTANIAGKGSHTGSHTRTATNGARYHTTHAGGAGHVHP
jgi:hypothetical protein